MADDRDREIRCRNRIPSRGSLCSRRCRSKDNLFIAAGPSSIRTPWSPSRLEQRPGEGPNRTARVVTDHAVANATAERVVLAPLARRAPCHAAPSGPIVLFDVSLNHGRRRRMTVCRCSG